MPKRQMVQESRRLGAPNSPDSPTSRTMPTPPPFSSGVFSFLKISTPTPYAGEGSNIPTILFVQHSIRSIINVQQAPPGAERVPYAP
jgi:hypothetical protein